VSLFRYNPEIHDDPRSGQHSYDPNQPRVPKGHSDGGRWTSGGGEGLAKFQPNGVADDSNDWRDAWAEASPEELQDSSSDKPRAPLNQVALLQIPAAIVAAGAENAAGSAAATWLGLSAYSALSQRNTRDRRAVIEFNAKQFGPDESSEIDLKSITSLNYDQVKSACKRIEIVQGIVDKAVAEVRADELRNRTRLSPSQFGTAVHTIVEREIKLLNDPMLSSEVSFVKMKEENGQTKDPEVKRGTKGSIRVDVYEKTDNGTVCVYDIKTGWSGLSIPRINEIAFNSWRKGSPYFIITEIRPSE
jgi:hypothetical protein